MEKTNRAEMLTPVCQDGTGEYILPDYQGDIKKILSVDGTLIPTGKYVTDYGAEVSATVHFRVLYLDSEGKVTSAEFDCDFENKLPLDMKEVQNVYPETVLTSYAVRATGPRKLSAKYTVCIIGSSEYSGNCMEGGAVFDDTDTEILKKTVNHYTTKHGASDEREFAEELYRSPEMNPEEIEILQTAGNVVVEESHAEENGVRIKGRLILTALIKTPDQPPFLISKEIPFEEVVGIEGLTPDFDTTANGFVSSVVTHANKGEDGDLVLTADAIAEFSAMGHGNEQVTLPVDGYATDCQSTARTRDVSFQEYVGCCASPVTIKLSEHKPDEKMTIRQILTSSSQIKVKSVTPTDKGLQIIGEASVCCVGTEANTDSTVKYQTKKFSSDFETEVPLQNPVTESAKYAVTLTPTLTSTLLDDDKLTAQILCSARVLAVNPTTVGVLSEISRTDDPAKKAPVIRVVYPERGETLWSIGKRYGKPLSEIAEHNHLDVPTGTTNTTPLPDGAIFIY